MCAPPKLGSPHKTSMISISAPYLPKSFRRSKKKLPHSDFLNLLFENALRHERDVIADMVYETPEGTTLDQRALSTFQFMQAGVEPSIKACSCRQRRGIPDLLEKVIGNSKFGSYFYRPVDIKAGSGYENQEKGTLRNDYGMQLHHYGTLLEAAQGIFPPMATSSIDTGSVSSTDSISSVISTMKHRQKCRRCSQVQRLTNPHLIASLLSKAACVKGSGLGF